jgi:hydrogenase expression/formation protein HypE
VDGDVVICSGPIGVHGISILSARESLGFETSLKSDTASLNGLTTALQQSIDVHVFRDPTRGGVVTTMNEIAAAASIDIILDEASLPIPQAVRTAADLLGLDPLFIANEGILLIILPEEDAPEALRILHSRPEGREAAIIGRVSKGSSMVRLKTLFGGTRILNMPAGEQLPRIC